MSDLPFVDRLGDAFDQALAPDPPPRRNWGPIAAAAGFAVVLGAGAVWWIVGAGSRSPRPDPVAPTTTVAGTTTTTPPTTLPRPTGLPEDWARLPEIETLGGQPFVTLNSVKGHAGGFVATGTGSGSGGTTAIVADSPDGVAWSALPTAGLEGAFVNEVAVGAGGTIVAVGGLLEDAPQARFWRFDGERWVAADVDPGPPASQANVVLALETGFVAGGVAFLDAERLEPQVPALWVSDDGTRWSSRSPGEAAAGHEADVSGLAALGSRVAAGGLWSEEELSSDPVVWVSDDLENWQRHVLPSDTGGFAGVQGLAAGGPGLVAVGFEERVGRVGAVWTSPDGDRWERAPHDDALFGGGAAGSVQMSDVAALPDGGLVAVGTESSGVRSRKVIWTSPDGSTWRRFDVAGPPVAGGETLAFGVAAARGTVVVVGAELSAGVEEAVAAAWVSPAPAGIGAEQPVAGAPPPPPPEATAVAVEPARATAATTVLVNVDGAPGEDDVVWLVGPDGQSIEACTAAARGGRQRWCRFRPGDVGAAAVGIYAVALDDPGEPLDGMTLEIVPSGVVLVRLDGVYTPFLHPLVQQLSVRNDGDQPLDLTGWSVQAPRSGQQRFDFPAGAELPPGTTAVIYQGGPGGARCDPDGALFFRTCNHFEGGVGATAYWTNGAVLVDDAGDVLAEWTPPR